MAIGTETNLLRESLFHPLKLVHYARSSNAAKYMTWLRQLQLIFHIFLNTQVNNITIKQSIFIYTLSIFFLTNTQINRDPEVSFVLNFLFRLAYPLCFLFPIFAFQVFHEYFYMFSCLNLALHSTLAEQLNIKFEYQRSWWEKKLQHS